MLYLCLFLSLFLHPLMAEEQLYHYMKGTGKEKSSFPSNKIMTLNACMLDWILAKKFGGMTAPASKRVVKLGALIKKQDPDVYLGQELTLESGTLLYNQLKDRYPHFWVGMGINEGNSGLFAASKYPIVSVAKFFSFPDSIQRAVYARVMDRGFFCLETPQFWIATSHFEGGDPADVGKYWKEELEFVTQTMDKITNGKPYILAGDLNIQRWGKPGDPYSKVDIQKYYYDYYTEHHPEFNEDTYTNTNLFSARSNGEPDPTLATDRNEIDDYFLIRKPFQNLFEDLEVVLILDTYNEDEPAEKAITDHRGYAATFSIE